MWSSFRGKYPCTSEIISFSIGIIAGVFIWAIFSTSEYAFLLAIFGGGAVCMALMGEKITDNWWPKSVKQKVKEEEKFLPKFIKRQRSIPLEKE